MKKVHIICPECDKTGIIEVQEKIVEERQKGIAAINVSEKLVCKHSFVVYIDKEFIIRDAILIDFTIELPQVNLDQKIVIDPDRYDENIDYSLISIDTSALTLTFILKGSFNGKKVIFINDLEVSNENLIKLFKKIFNGLFIIDILILTKETYKKEKKKYKDCIIIENNKVIKDKTKIINHKGLKIERAIIQIYLAEPDPTRGLILFKNEIQKAFIFSNDIIDYLNNFNASKDLFKDGGSDYSLVRELVESVINKEKMILKVIIEYLSKKYDIKFQRQYTKFLLGIIKNYFKIDIMKKIQL